MTARGGPTVTFDSSAREALAREMEAALQRHVVNAWFPRSIDDEHGGFHQRFDRRWRLGRSASRMLEFQARQARAAARLALAFPDEAMFRDAARHGFRYMRDVMADREAGGLYWLVDREGRPLADGLKHGHSTAYAVQSLALSALAIGDEEPLALARTLFRWFDAHAHDADFGGYHSWLTREGRPVTGPGDAPPGSVDPLEHAPGLKDVNVHGDWLEALQEYGAISGDDAASERVSEIGRLMVERITNAAGELHYAFHRDWWPQPALERYGYHFQNVPRLLRLDSVPEAKARSRALLVHAARAGASRRGGYVFARPSGPPAALYRRAMEVPHRAWWAQFEALRALAIYALSDDPKAHVFERLFLRQWAFVRDNLFDHAWAGVYEVPRDDRPPAQRYLGRLAGNRRLAKAHAWKDASHETDVLIAIIRLLRGVPEGPLGQGGRPRAATWPPD